MRLGCEKREKIALNPRPYRNSMNNPTTTAHKAITASVIPTTFATFLIGREFDDSDEIPF